MPTQSQVPEAKEIVADFDRVEITDIRYDGSVTVDVERYVAAEESSLPRLLGRFSYSGWNVLNIDFEAQRIVLLYSEEF